MTTESSVKRTIIRTAPVRPIIDLDLCRKHAGRVGAFNRDNGRFICSAETYADLDEALAQRNVAKSSVIRFHFLSLAAAEAEEPTEAAAAQRC